MHSARDIDPDDLETPSARPEPEPCQALAASAVVCWKRPLAGSVDDAVALLREHYQHAAKIILDDPRLFAADGVG